MKGIKQINHLAPFSGHFRPDFSQREGETKKKLQGRATEREGGSTDIERPMRLATCLADFNPHSIR